VTQALKHGDWGGGGTGFSSPNSEGKRGGSSETIRIKKKWTLGSEVSLDGEDLLTNRARRKHLAIVSPTKRESEKSTFKSGTRRDAISKKSRGRSAGDHGGRLDCSIGSLKDSSGLVGKQIGINQ